MSPISQATRQRKLTYIIGMSILFLLLSIRLFMKPSPIQQPASLRSDYISPFLTQSLQFPHQKIVSHVYGRGKPTSMKLSLDETYLGILHNGYFELFDANTLSSIKVITPVENMNLDTVPVYIDAIFAEKLYLLKLDGNIDIFALHSWQKLETLQLDIQLPRQWALNPDDGILAVCDSDHTIHLYDIKTKSILRSISIKQHVAEYEVISLAYFPSNKAYLIVLNTTEMYYLTKTHSIIPKGRLTDEQAFSRYAQGQVFNDTLFIGSMAYNIKTFAHDTLTIEGVQDNPEEFAIGERYLYAYIYFRGLLKVDKRSREVVEENDIFEWNFRDVFFRDEINLPAHADMIILYNQGYEYLNVAENVFFDRQSFNNPFLDAVIDKQKNLLLIGKMKHDVKLWNPLTQEQVHIYQNILTEDEVISLGYHPTSQYCAVLYPSFDMDVFNDEGEHIFAYSSQAESQIDDQSGQYQNIYFRDAQTLYFFDRDVLIKVDLATKTFTKEYKVTNLEKHSGYHYYFNPNNKTVTISSEYCAGCDVGGKILIIDLDTIAVVNNFSTRDYGQSFTFCKYYDQKFITAARMFETFTINEIIEATPEKEGQL